MNISLCRSAGAGMVEDSYPSETFRNNIDDAWRGSYGMIQKDMGRLVRRLRVFEEGEEVFVGEEFERWEGCIELFKILLRHFEPEEKLASLMELLGSQVQDSNDLEMGLRCILDELNKANVDNAVFGVLRACTQTLVYQPSFEIISRLFDNNLLKDVSGAGGWNLEIRLRRDVAHQVYHRKKQQNLKSDDDPEHLTVQWELGMTFSTDMQELNDTCLNLIDVEYNEHMPAEMQKEWDTKLAGGNMRVL